MEFIYFVLPDGRYLSMNNLQNSGEFVKNNYNTPTIFPVTTDIEDIFNKIKNKPDIKAILTKTFTV